MEQTIFITSEDHWIMFVNARIGIALLSAGTSFICGVLVGISLLFLTGGIGLGRGGIQQLFCCNAWYDALILSMFLTAMFLVKRLAFLIFRREMGTLISGWLV